MAQLLLQVNAITKQVMYQGVEKTIPDTYWTSDIIPAIYPTWDADKDKLVLFAWYDNDTYMCQRRKYVMNFKTNAFEWKDYEMEQVDNGIGKTLFDKFKDTFFLVDSLETQEYQNEFAKLHAAVGVTSWLTVRLARNFLLTETDWVFLEDSGVSAADKELYKKYRTKLRDLPANNATSDPKDIKFPIPVKYFKEIYSKKGNASSDYLGTTDQYAALSAHYGTTFREKFASYLIVKEISDSLYYDTFLTALKNSEMVYEPNLNVRDFENMTFTDAEKTKTKDYLDLLIKGIDSGEIG